MGRERTDAVQQGWRSPFEGMPLPISQRGRSRLGLDTLSRIC